MDYSGLSKKELLEKIDSLEKQVQDQAPEYYKSFHNTIFYESPIPLWEEEYTDLINHMDGLKDQGISDFPAYFEEHPEALWECVTKLKIIKVNRSVLNLLEAETDTQVYKGLSSIFNDKSLEAFKNVIMALYLEENHIEQVAEIMTLQGNIRMVDLRIVTAPTGESSRKYIIVASQDITEIYQEEKVQSQYVSFLENLNRLDLAVDESSFPGESLQPFLELIQDIFSSDRVFLTPVSTENKEIPIKYQCVNDSLQTLDSLNLELIQYNQNKEPKKSRTPSLLCHKCTKKLSPTAVKRMGIKTHMHILFKSGTGHYWILGVQKISPEVWHSSYKQLFVEIGNRLSNTLTNNFLYKNLKDSQEKFRYVLENSVPVIYSYNITENQFEYMSPSSREVLGLNPRDIIDQGILLLYSRVESEYLKSIIEDQEQYLKNKLTRNKREPWVYKYNHPKKGQRWLQDNFSIQLDSQGNPGNIIGQIIDITQQVESEESLRRYEYIVSSFQDMVALISRDFIYLAVNDKFASRWNLKQEKFINKAVAEIMGETVFEDIIKPHGLKCLAGETVYYKTWFDFNEEKRFLEIYYYPYRNSQDEIEGFVVNARDSTDRKLSEEILFTTYKELEASEERFKLVVNASNLGIFDWDFRKDKAYYSPVYKLQIGYGEDELPGKFSIWEDHLHPDERKAVVEKVNAFIENPQDCSYVDEYRFRHRAGHYIWIHSRAEIVIDDTGKAVRMLGTHRDITDLKKSRIALEEQNRELALAKEKAEESDRLKSSFLANMSHEIRTPMNGIIGFADLLRSTRLSGEERDSYISLIERSGERMLEIINNLIDISKVESNQIEVNISDVNINELMDYVESFFQAEASRKSLVFKVHKSLSDNQCLYKTDKEKIYAILINLSKNAVKFTSQGTIDVSYTVKDGDISFTIKDSGRGIDEKDQESIFDRFIQAEQDDSSIQQGAGLGLAITRAYVKLLGGRIHLESKKGEGSQFTVVLPFNRSNKNSISNQKSKSVTEISSRLHILVAEDDDISAHFLSIVLKDCSRRFKRVHTGRSAVDYLRENKDVDLILMDIRMPGMSGIEAVQEIRTFNKEVKIIAQTAHGLSGDKERALEAGCTDYLKKPIQKKQLLNIIGNYFT